MNNKGQKNAKEIFPEHRRVFSQFRGTDRVAMQAATKGRNPMVVMAKNQIGSIQGTRSQVSITPFLQINALADLAGAIVGIALSQGYPLAESSGLFYAIQSDYLAAAGGKIPEYQKAPQWWWDIRFALTPKTVRGATGSFNYSFDVRNLVPINNTVHNNCVLAGPSTTTQNGLAILNVLAVNVDVVTVLVKFFEFISSSTYLIEREKADSTYLRDPSAFAYKTEGTFSFSVQNIDGNPGPSNANLEVPIRSTFAHLGLCTKSSFRMNNYSLPSHIGAAAVASIVYQTRRQGSYPQRFTGSYKPIRLEDITISVFSMLITAKAAADKANQSNFPFDTIDGVTIVLYLYNVLHTVMGIDAAAQVGVDYPGLSCKVGTNSFNSQWQSNTGPANIVESLKSLVMSLRSRTSVFIPQLTVENNHIAMLKQKFPEFTFDLWGGTNLNLFESKISNTLVRLSPYPTSPLGTALNQVNTAFNLLQTNFTNQAVNGFNIFSLLGYIRIHETPTDSSGEVMVRASLSRFKDAASRYSKYVDRKQTHPLNNEPDEALVATVLVQGTFKPDYILDQTLILPALYETELSRTQAYALYGCGQLIDGPNGSSVSDLLATNSSNYVRDSVNPATTEQSLALEMRQKMHIGGAAVELFGESTATQTIDRLIDSGGVAFRAINWVAGKIIGGIRDKISKRRSKQ